MLRSGFGARRRKAQTPVLGERELAVLDVLWLEGAQTAQQIIEQMEGWSVSLSTVQSTLERLHRKEMVARSKQARAYVYEARISRSDIISSLLHDMTEEIAGGDMAPVLSGFIDYLRADPAAAGTLSRLVNDVAGSEREPGDA